MTSDTAKGLTAERKSTHGDWDEGAAITTDVMERIRQGSKWDSMTPGMKEAVHMIIHKIHRIATGNPFVQDHWDDIQGYAELVSRKLREQPPGAVQGTVSAQTDSETPRVSLREAQSGRKAPRSSRHVARKGRGKGKPPGTRKANGRAPVAEIAKGDA